MPVAIVIGITDIRLIFKASYMPYLVVLVLLVVVEVFGHTVMGGKRWIDLAGFRVQPSEPIKVALVLMLSKYLHNMSEVDVNSNTKLIVPIFLLLIPTTLVMKQPDLGTGILIVVVGAILLFTAGVKLWKFIVAGCIAGVCAPMIWYFLYDYQKKRILVFLNPEMDPLGAGYNIIQSKIAIGSGGFTGKGLTQGTQNRLDFLPEHQTDFIFASMAEEFGFMGVSLLIALYCLVIYIALAISINARAAFAKLLAIGITSIFFLHAFINMAMVIGWMPAVGIPLPFISYGGAMMASMLCGFGLIMNVHVNRHVNLK